MTEPSHNLPAEAASFIGRRSELAEVDRLLQETRLLTLTGVGGSGKTRLAVRAAASVTQRFADGVWLVELAPVADSSLVARTVAGAAGVRGAPDKQLQAVLVTALAPRRMLLVLDNCEHVIGACAQLVDTLLRGCPRLRVLATSREPLRIPGEVTLRVPPLATEGPAAATSEGLATVDSVALFLERARARKPDFRLSDSSSAAVGAICRRLEGLPLAIELAAAQMGALTPELIAARLDDALRVLAGGDRTLPRQETLRAALDWSHGLLTAEEQALFRRLAVFAGSFPVEAAEEIGSGSDLARADIMPVLAKLVEKSLIEPHEEGARFRLLEPVRQYAWDLAKDRREDGDLQRRHATFFLEMAAGLEQALMSGGPERNRALRQLAAEQDNLRVALGWTRSAGAETEVEAALRASAALGWYWNFRGEASEGLTWLESLLAKSARTSSEARAKTLYMSCELAWSTGHGELARRRAEESEAEWRRMGDKRWLAYTLQSLPMAIDHPNARRNVEESVGLFEETGDRWGLAMALMGLDYLQLARGETSVEEAGERNVRRWQELGDDWGTAQALNMFGDLARAAGEDDLAERCYRESLSRLRRQGLQGTVPSLLHNLGWLAIRRGEVRKALQLFQESLGLFTDQGDQRGMADALTGVAAAAGAMQQPGKATWLFGAAEALRQHVEATIWPANSGDYEASMARVREQMDEPKFSTFWRRGRAASITEILDEALPKRSTDGVREAGQGVALTPREREVAVLVAQGMTNRQIGAALFITEGTARLHVKHILGKLGFGSRSQVAAWVVAQG